MSTQSQDSLLRIVLVVLAVVVLAPLVLMALAMPMMGMGMMGAWGGSGMGFSPLWGVGMMLVSLLVVLGIGYLVYRVLVESRPDRDPALAELRSAYARGDLTDEEFEQRRERLREDRG